MQGRFIPGPEAVTLQAPAPVIFVSFLVLVVGLIFEAALHGRRLRRIPLRIAVTGTRGKSGTVRLICSVLRADGKRVLGKITGTDPCLLLPDGSEEPIRRRGLVSILEQKRLVRRAVRQEAEVVVAEVMSLHEENHLVESRRLLAPHIVALTNVRSDHTEAMGPDERAVAGALGRTFVRGCRVFLPGGEGNPVLLARAGDVGARLEPVTPGAGDADPPLPWWPEQIALARAAASAAGLDASRVETGLREGTKADGHGLVWKMRHTGDGRIRYLVDAFAANDPLSTDLLLTRIRSLLPDPSAPTAALLALRNDRGGRTLQWIAALSGPLADRFAKVFVAGGHARAAARRLRAARVLNADDAVEATRLALDALPPGGVLAGIGNHVGTAEHLIAYWRREGEPHGL